MHKLKKRFKALALCLALVLPATLGLAAARQNDTTVSKDTAVTKLEQKKDKLKQANKTPKAPEVKPAEAPKAPEIKQEAPKPTPPPPKPITPDKKKFAGPNGYQLRTDGTEVNFRSMGVIYMNGFKYSYYSSRVLYHYRTPEWYACDDHLYRTADGYIVVASGDFAQGAIVDTPFGKGKVLDHCHRNKVIDIYVNF